MPLSEKACDALIQQYATYNPIYIWGKNWSKITDRSEIYTLYNTFGSPSGKYNEAYYTSKVDQALNGSGYASDCSGMFYNIDGRKIDRTAQGYYSNCQSKGDISSIDTTHSCVVFRGTNSKINHIAYYNASDGYVYEMANSDDNFKKTIFNPKYWTYWGRPEFIDYSIQCNLQSSTVSTYLYKGIDISTYQKNVDYKKLKDAGVQFAILKIINKKLNPDDQFEIHYMGCTTYGIDVSCYNYSYATTIEQARDAANAVLNVLNGRKMPVYLDVEDNIQKGLGEYLADIINAYQEVIERAGLIFGVYTGMSFYNTYLAPYRAKLKCQNWHIARYYNGYNPMDFSEDPNESYKPNMLTTSWQYTSSGIVSGINGRVDLDVMYALPKEPSSSPVIIPTPIPTVSDISQLNPVIRNTVKTNGKRLNVRNRPSTDSTVVGKMNNGSNVIIYGVDKTGQWARLSVEKDLWSSTDYISSTGKGIVTAEKSLYIRSSDSKLGEVWGVYKANTIVKILHQSTNTGWYLTVGTDKDGKQVGGWCSNNYIRTQ